MQSWYELHDDSVRRCILEGTSHTDLWNLLIIKGLNLLKNCEISVLQHDCFHIIIYIFDFVLILNFIQISLYFSVLALINKLLGTFYP